ncbi:hypothetical protein ACIBKY_51160 [Nonomuraea sp. NPDC050394]|uniref:hypothetical protein n=1 Tax=Nonomuraea sp. NPDC050394 TaxID=3364363 RepID=UPI0037B35B99
MSGRADGSDHSRRTSRKHGCCCPACLKLHKQYEVRKAQLKQEGRWQPFTDPAPVREHLERLRRETGFGPRAIADLTGVGYFTIVRVAGWHKHLRGPSKIHTWRAERILAFWPTHNQIPKRMLVSATGTHRRIQALMVKGWCLAWLSREMGTDRSVLSWTLKLPQVEARTAQRVRALYDRLWNQEPPQQTRQERRAVNMTRARARAAKWMPPLAWDDDSIDDPEAVPDRGARETRDQALTEDSDWLMAVEGFDLVQAAERLGVSHVYLAKARSRWAQKLSDEVTDAC